MRAASCTVKSDRGTAPNGMLSDGESYGDDDEGALSSPMTSRREGEGGCRGGEKEWYVILDELR